MYRTVAPCLKNYLQNAWSKRCWKKDSRRENKLILDRSRSRKYLKQNKGRMKIKRTRWVSIEFEENSPSMTGFCSKYMFVSKEWPLINVYDLQCWIQDSFRLSKKYPSWHFCKIMPYNINLKKITNDAMNFRPKKTQQFNHYWYV